MLRAPSMVYRRLGRAMMSTHPPSKSHRKRIVRKNVRNNQKYKHQLGNTDPPVHIPQKSMTSALHVLSGRPKLGAGWQLKTYTKNRRLFYEFDGRVLLSIAADSWIGAFRCEETLLSELERRRQLKEKYPTRKPAIPSIPDNPQEELRVSGDALLLNPSGVTFLYGTKEDVEQLIQKSSFENDESFAFALSLQELAENNNSLMNMQSFLRKKTLEVRSDVSFPYSRFGEGVYRFMSALRSIDTESSNLDQLYAYILVEKRAKKREPYSVTLAGGKRNLFETAHKSAERLLSVETGLQVDVSFDCPSVTHSGNNKMVVFMKNISSNNDDLVLNNDFDSGYAERFQSPVFIEGSHRNKTT